MNVQTLAGQSGKHAASGGILTSWVPALGRLMISVIFLLSGASKIAAPAATIVIIRSAGLPLPQIAFGLSVCVELLGGIALLVGFHTRVVATMLFFFTLATAVFFHANLGDQNQLIHFFKNIAMAGGLLHVLALGGSRLQPRCQAWLKGTVFPLPPCRMFIRE